jgi:polysaccharide export outer membrane protein
VTARFLAVLALAVACTPTARPVSLPPPVQASAVDVGDVFIMHVVGEEKVPTEYTVAPDGTVDFPYIQRMVVAGLEPQQIAERVRGKLIEMGVLTNPSVTVSMKAYNSKRVVVTGEVKTAGSMQLEPGMTLVRAVSQAGGLTPLARRNAVILRRKVGTATRAVVVDYEAITNNEIPDIPLQAGDTIHVPQRVF